MRLRSKDFLNFPRFCMVYFQCNIIWKRKNRATEARLDVLLVSCFISLVREKLAKDSDTVEFSRKTWKFHAVDVLVLRLS
jgi:hypothetical protein